MQMETLSDDYSGIQDIKVAARLLLRKAMSGD